MPRATKEKEAPVEETNGKRPYVPRLSISVTSEMQRNLRLAAAIANKTVGEWCTEILEKYAEKAIEEAKVK